MKCCQGHIDEKEDVPKMRVMNNLFETYGPPSVIKDILESGEALYREEQKGTGKDFSHYKWSRAHRAHLNNLSLLRTLNK